MTKTLKNDILLKLQERFRTKKNFKHVFINWLLYMKNDLSNTPKEKLTETVFRF